MISLAGTWEIRREGADTWRPVQVPGCWEEAGFPKTDSGPYWYRKIFQVPGVYAGKRVWLHFGAVSYACHIWINGQSAGKHTGMWDAFSIDITRYIQAGEPVELLVQVEKPASLTSGPDSAYQPGHYRLRETLSGFLPYVWGHAFGGIWQDVELYATGERYIADTCISGTPDGQVSLSITTSAPGMAHVSILAPGGDMAWESDLFIDRIFIQHIKIYKPIAWAPSAPAVYTARISLPDEEERIIRFGLRAFQSEGRKFTLNGKHIYPRMILSWGWYPERLIPHPDPEKVRRDFRHLRDLGYNGVKLCLWFPPPYYFELADEFGMLLWVELPMWLPSPNEQFSNQAIQEYDQLVRQARQHPSVVLYTLGCELNRAVDDGLLAQLYTQTKGLTSGSLVRDNSGSGEAYQGSLHEHADFDDNHLYSELHFLRPVLDSFSPAWREMKPWLMGEFCDYDTFSGLTDAWWTDPDPLINPQGARWEMRKILHAARLRQCGLEERIDEITAASYQQAMVHRKYTIETVRSRSDLTGYVITGEVDTPVSSAGMWDVAGNVKFSPDRFSQFNQDFVLSLGWDRRRAWIAGGDRPSPSDRYNYMSGATVRIHLIGSNFSRYAGQARVFWDVGFTGQEPFASGETAHDVHLHPGEVQGLGVMEFTAPQVTTPRQAVLHAWVNGQETLTANTWTLWFYPSDPWTDILPFGLDDTRNLLGDLSRLCPERCRPGIEGVSVIICTDWTAEADAFVNQGGNAILLSDLNSLPGPLPVAPVPYWREALKIIENHPSWGDFPHGNAPDLQFYTMAPDCALDANKFSGEMRPIYRRLDMRGMELLEYAVELHRGKGRMILTTLRFFGGLGDQPVSLKNCPAGQHLLANWVRSLHQ